MFPNFHYLIVLIPCPSYQSINDGKSTHVGVRERPIREISFLYSSLIFKAPSFEDFKSKPVQSFALSQTVDTPASRDGAATAAELTNGFTTRAYELRKQRLFDHANALEVISFNLSSADK